MSQLNSKLRLVFVASALQVCMMSRFKLRQIVISTCLLSFVGALLTMKFTNVLSRHSFTERPMSSMSTFLFNYSKTEPAVLNCITGDVVGERPSDVAMVDVRQLRSSSHNELDQHRKAMFSEIFHAKVWGKNSKVNFSASGKPNS